MFYYLIYEVLGGIGWQLKTGDHQLPVFQVNKFNKNRKKMTKKSSFVFTAFPETSEFILYFEEKKVYFSVLNFCLLDFRNDEFLSFLH